MEMLLFGGPILAMVAGVYAMGREQGQVERFWRSRPIDLNRWLVSKYIVGLAVVWLVCWIPLSIQIAGGIFISNWTYDDTLESLSMSLVYSFILLLIYSVSFVLGRASEGSFMPGFWRLGPWL